MMPRPASINRRFIASLRSPLSASRWVATSLCSVLKRSASKPDSLKRSAVSLDASATVGIFMSDVPVTSLAMSPARSIIDLLSAGFSAAASLVLRSSSRRCSSSAIWRMMSEGSPPRTAAPVSACLGSAVIGAG